MKSALAGKRKRKAARWLLALAAFAAAAAFLHLRKEAVFEAFVSRIETTIARGTGLDVRFGRVSGRFPGLVRIEDLEISEPSAGGRIVLFECREILLRYRLLDLISKDPVAKVQIELRSPRLRWEPRFRVLRRDLPILTWMRRAAVTRGRDVVIHAEGAEFEFGARRFGPIDLRFEGGRLRAEMAVHHFEMAAFDVSTEVVVEARFLAAADARDDSLTGTVMTEGTVVNWRPLPYETRFEFELSRHLFNVRSEDLFGGIDFAAEYRLDDDEVRWAVAADEYSLANLDPLFNLSKGLSVPGSVTFDLRVWGDPLNPSYDGRARIRNGWISRRPFEAMDLSFEGVYPTLRLYDSRLLLKDGTAMRFADRTFEASDVFRERTYRTLVSEAQQDSVVWGDWELTRSKGKGDRSDLLMQRSFGDNARLQLRRTNVEDDVPRADGLRSDERRGVGVGFEYRLQSRDALKFEVREGEEFVGVERKLKF